MEIVDCAEIHVGASPRRLPEHLDRERRLSQNRLQRGAGQVVEHPSREVRLRGDTAPDSLDRSVGGRQPRKRSLHRAILNGDRAGDGDREDGRPD